ncbi:MAG: hypothetical protein HY717_20680 [Planctomycetes bacterium]|nr:hypothetical protein [Planctomycetota bacterium]
MVRNNALMICGLVFFDFIEAYAEFPLPDTIVYGTITLDGNLITSGNLIGRVNRFGRNPMEVPAEFSTHQGITYYVLRIPLESNVGAPGPSGVAGRVGDRLEVLILNGGELTPQPGITLDVAKVVKFSIGAEPPPPGFFKRGDCDSSGALDVTDAIVGLIYLFLGGAEPKCMEACNVDDAGDYDITDAISFLQSIFLGAFTIMPPAFPLCGVDPTPSSVSCKQSHDDCNPARGGPDNAPGGGGGGVAKSLDEGPDKGGTRNLLNSSLKNASEPGNLLFARPLPLPGNSQDQEVMAGFLEISPSLIHFGVISSEAQRKKTLTVRNPSHSGALQFSARSNSELFSVYPATFTLPPGGSLVVFVESNASASKTENALHNEELPNGAAVSFTINGHIESEIGVQYSFESNSPRISIGDVAIVENSTDMIALPIEAHGEIDRVALLVEYDESKFDGLTVIPVSGIEWRRMTENFSPGTLALTIKVNAPAANQILGYLLLSSRNPLPIGTYPVLLKRALDGEGKLLGVSHGEICCHKPWLDLDGDGVLAPGYDAVLVQRFFAGKKPFWPNGWPEAAMDLVFLTRQMEARFEYFDIDQSGNFDSLDLAKILRGLNGFSVGDKNHEVRVRNLYVARKTPPIEWNALRFALREESQALKPGTRVHLPLFLDTDEPVAALKAALNIDPPLLKLVGLWPGSRLISPSEDTFISTLETGLHLELMGEFQDAPAIRAGTEAVADFEFEISPLAQEGFISLQWTSSTQGVRGLATRVAIAAQGTPKLSLEVCASGEEPASYVSGAVKCAGQPGINYLQFTVSYPAGLFSCEELKPVSAFKDSMRVEFEDRPGEGKLRVLAYQLLGNSLFTDAQSAALLTFTLKATSPLSGLGGMFALQIDSAYSGKSPVILDAEAMSLKILPGCDENGEDCGQESFDLGLNEVKALLDHLFLGGPKPACPQRFDLDGDGGLSLNDAILIAHRS